MMFWFVIVSYLAVSIHLWVEYKTFEEWGGNNLPKIYAQSLTKGPLGLCSAVIFLIYSFICFYYLFTRNDFSITLLLAAQGAIMLNAFMHFYYRKIVTLNMPGFEMACLVVFPISLVIIIWTFQTWWVTVFLKFQIIFFGILVQLLLPIALMNLASKFIWKSQRAQNLQKFEENDQF